MRADMDMHQEEEIIVHDIRGQICPSCLLYTLRELNHHRAALKRGSMRVIIKTDNRHATSTIPDAVATMGYGYDVKKMDEGYYQIEIMAKNR
jgi:TusA-related sulfurtransferase